MTTAATTNRPIAPLSLVVRAAVAVAAVAFVAAAWLEAGHSSHQAVQQAQASFSRTYVTLPRVDIVARRERSTHTASLPARRTTF